MQMQHRYTLSALAENVPGVLQRLAIVFTRRKINIESMTVSETGSPNLSRFTFVVQSDAETVRKVLAQVSRIVELRDVSAHRDAELVYKELAMLRVGSRDSGEMERIAVEFGARLSREETGSFLFEKSGTECEISNLYSRLMPFQIQEFVRSGRIALAKNSNEFN
jgi:acetolactate synthase-1/3 small subunit